MNLEDPKETTTKGGSTSKWKKLLRRSVTALLIFIFMFPIIIHYEPIQQLIVKTIASQIASKTGSEVDLQRVDFSIFRGFILEELFISEVDNPADTLAYIGELSTSLEENILTILRKNIHIRDINLFDAKLKIRTQKGDSLSNLAEFLAGLASNEKNDSTAASVPPNILLQNINLKNIYLAVEDDNSQNSLLASLEEAYLGVEELNIEKDSFLFHSISLYRPQFTKTEITKSLPDSLSMDLDSLSLKSEVKARSPYLSIGILEIDEGAFQSLKSNTIVNLSRGNSLDFNDLDITELDLTMMDFSYQAPMNIFAHLEHLSMNEHNGLELSEFSVDSLWVDSTRLVLDGFDLQTKGSKISDYLAFSFDSFSDLSERPESIKLVSDMAGSDIAVADLSYFMPGLADAPIIKKNMDRKISITGAVTGSLDKLQAENLYLSIDNLVDFYGEFSVVELSNPEDALLNLYVRDLNTSLLNLRKILPGFKPPQQFYKLGNINFTGDIEGFLKDFVIYGKMQSRLGAVTLDTRLNTKPGINLAQYSGEIALRDFNLEEWTGNKDFGLATLNAKIENGEGLTLDKVKTDLAAELVSFEFKDYKYENVALEGKLEKNLFNGVFVVNDPNVIMDFDGQIVIKEDYFKSDFVAFIDKINPIAINLSNDYSNVQGNFNLSIEGKTLNDFSGSAEFNDMAVIFRDKEFEFRELYFSSAPGKGRTRNLLLTSDVMNASVDGVFDFAQLVPAFKNFIVKYHPQWADKLKISKSVKELKKQQNFAYKFEVFDTKDYLELVKLNDLRFQGVTLEGAINLDENKFNGNISIDSSSYRNYSFQAFGLALTNNKQISKLIIDLDKMINKSKVYEPLQVKSELNGDDIRLSIKTEKLLDSIGYVDLNLNISPLADKVMVNIENQNLQMFSTDWEIDESNRIIYGKDYLSIEDFILSDGYRAILIQDYKKSGLEFNLENFNFLLVNGLINYDKIDFAGEGSVYARIANIFNKPAVVADIRIPEFTLNDVDYGALSVRLDDDGEKSYASLNLNRIEDDLRLLLDAEYNKTTKNVNGHVSMRNMVMNTFEFIIDDGISDTEGIANLEVDIFGNIDDIKLDGTANVIGGQTRIDYIGTLMDLGTETFTITDKMIDLTGVSLYDKFGNQATMTGGLRHDLFAEFTTDLNIRSERFLALETSKTDNNMYYGIGIGDMSVDFYGPFSSVDIVINATTGPGTILNIPVEDSYYDVDKNFIKFVPRDEIQNPSKKLSVNESVKIEGVDVDMNLTMTEDAQVNIIFDEKLNDIIRGVGNGDLRITIARDGKFNIFGEYEVERGEYLFTAWGVVAKPFQVRRGGLITWTGDPINANLNLEADYADLRAPVNILLAEYLVSTNTNLEQQARKRTRIDLTLKIGGTLYTPDVNFDIAFPELQGELRTYADSKMITLRENEADLNEQVAGLIMFRSFLPSSSLGSVFTTGNSFVETTYNTLSEFVSNQLSYLLSGFLQEALTENGFISGIDFEIGFSKNANLLGGAPQSDNYLPDEIEVHFKPRFQNDKWGFDYGTSFVNANAQSTRVITNYVIHDFVLEYYLTPDRRLKLRAYGRWDRDEVVFENEQRYGLGINYRKEFGSLTDFKRGLSEDLSSLKIEDQPNED